MALEKFSRQRKVRPPSASIRRKGDLSINGEAIGAFNLQEMRFATLHYDRKELSITVKPLAEKSDSDALEVRREKRSSIIRCPDFFDHYGIQYKERSRTFAPIWDEKGKAIVLKPQQNHSKEERHER